MRKFLLASVATLGTGGLIGTAVAQAPVVGAPTQGQAGLFAGGQPADRCEQQQQLSGTGTAGCARKPYAGHHRDPRERQGAEPIPGRMGQPGSTPPPLRPLAPPRSRRWRSTASCASTSAPTPWRPTACATVRRSSCGENFTGQISSNTSSGASGYTSAETVYVRRAFTYVAGEQWGILRVGRPTASSASSTTA